MVIYESTTGVKTAFGLCQMSFSAQRNIFSHLASGSEFHCPLYIFINAKRSCRNVIVEKKLRERR